jgi:hypothetical protein
MDLLIDGRALAIAKLGPDFFVLEALAEHPPGDAEVVVSVDGRKSTWPVHLPEGVKGSLRVSAAFRVPR